MPHLYLNDEQLHALTSIFHKVRINSKIKGSIIIPLLKKEKKNIQKFFTENAILISEVNVSDIDLEDLYSKKILKIVSHNQEKVVLTVKGLLLCEYHINAFIPEIDQFLNDLNSEYFDNIVQILEKPLDSVEKSIIITLLGLGAISEDFQLEVNSNNQNSFKEAVDLSKNFLLSLGDEFQQDGTLDKLWKSDVDGEDPGIALRKRTNELARKTENIYSTNNKKQFIKLIKNNSLDLKTTKYILKKVFDVRILDYEEKKQFLQVLDEIQRISFDLFSVLPSYDKNRIRRQIKLIIEDDL